MKKEEVKKKDDPYDVEPTDGLEKSIAKMFRMSHKEDESKSIVSGMSRASKNVMDMSVNELLSMRIPIARSNSKIE